MKVLIIEDSLVSQRAIKNYLLEFFPGVQFMEARNGEEGLSLYRQEKPDLILLDLLMPVLDGQAVLQEIRKEDVETPVAVVTANIQEMIKREVEDLGVLSFIKKPFTREKAQELARHFELLC